MGHVQDSPVATTMISNECMIYHMKVHIVSYNLGQNFFSKSKIHILTISGPISIKPAIVYTSPVEIVNMFESVTLDLSSISILRTCMLGMQG